MDYNQFLKTNDDYINSHDYLGYNQYIEYNHPQSVHDSSTEYKIDPERLEEDPYEYLPEYNQLNKNVPSSTSNYHNFLNFKKRPSNSLDYMKFQSEDYLRYKIENKVRDRIKELNLGNKIESQIVGICYNLYKKFKQNEKEKIRMCDLIPIVAFKFIKSNRIPISHKDAIEKLKLDKSKFLKFSNQICLGDEKVVFKFESAPNFNLKYADDTDLKEKVNAFNNKVYDYVSFLIQKLSEIYKSQPDSLKIKKDRGSIDFYLEKFEKIENVYSEGQFFDILKILDEVKKEANVLILGKDSSDKYSTFFDFFEKKILVEHLASAIVKRLSDLRGVKINLQIFRENFNIPISGISRGIKLVNEYLKTIKYNK